MSNFIKEFLYERRVNHYIKNLKKSNENFSNLLLKDGALKKYIKDIKSVISIQNQIIYDSKDKGNIEHQFAKLIALRQNELTKSVLLVINLNYTYCAIPLMRNLCDLLLLLKYVEKNPKYIKKFMRKNGRGINVWNIKTEINDDKLKDYYGFLSYLMHSNPDSIKLNFFELPDKRNGIMINHSKIDSLKKDMILSLIALTSESNIIINNICSINWKISTSN
ncbi:MAG: hypothetical protein PHV39_01900 [Methanomicrobium sp.]|nr:hypothetical protein [Methanomicrobium sp.]